MADAFRFIDVNAQKALLADFPLDVDHFDPGRSGGAFGGVAYALQLHGLAGGRLNVFSNKKVGSRPLGCATGFGRRFSIVAGNYKSKGPAGSLRLTFMPDGNALAGLNEGIPEQ